MVDDHLTVRQAQFLLEKLKGEVTVTVDDAMSTTSENPVQNKVITTAINDAVDALTNDPVDVTGSVSAANGSDATICLSAQYPAGVYLVSAYASFPASSTGRRHIHIATTNTGSALDGWSQLTLAPSNAQPTIMQLTGIYKRESTGRWYLRCYQNSGSAQTVSGGIRVLKLH